MRVERIQGLTRKFVPDSLGNKEHDDPASFMIRYPTEAQRRRFGALDRLIAGFARGLSKNTTDEEQLHAVSRGMFEGSSDWQTEMILACVLSVDSYEYLTDSGTGEEWVPIKTAKEFVEFGHEEIIREVACEIYAMASLSEESKKNSPKSSDSTPALNPSTQNAEAAESALDQTANTNTAPDGCELSPASAETSEESAQRAG